MSLSFSTRLRACHILDTRKRTTSSFFASRPLLQSSRVNSVNIDSSHALVPASDLTILTSLRLPGASEIFSLGSRCILSSIGKMPQPYVFSTNLSAHCVCFLPPEVTCNSGHIDFSKKFPVECVLSFCFCQHEITQVHNSLTFTPAAPSSATGSSLLYLSEVWKTTSTIPALTIARAHIRQGWPVT